MIKCSQGCNSIPKKSSIRPLNRRLVINPCASINQERALNINQLHIYFSFWSSAACFIHEKKNKIRKYCAWNLRKFTAKYTKYTESSYFSVFTGSSLYLGLLKNKLFAVSQVCFTFILWNFAHVAFTQI